MFTGIVAAVGRLAAVSQNNGAALRITAPFRAVKKGESIAVNGACLTVNAIPRPGVVQVSLVPFTREHTTLGKLGGGDRVHVEADVLGKYVRQLCRSAR